VSSEERDMILQMLAEGKVTPQEAADLLDALEPGRLAPTPHPGEWNRWQGDNAERFGSSSSWQDRGPAQRRSSSFAGRSLLIHVTDGDETKTNVNVPLGMALTAGKFIPRRAQEYFDRYGIDLASILEGIAHGDQNGELVNVRDGNTQVKIVVT
jgi:hypothetical protein